MAKQTILLGGVVKDEVAKINENFNEVFSALDNIPADTGDLTNNAGFMTASHVQEAINEATDDFVTSSEVNQAISQKTNGFATTQYVTEAVANKLDKEAGKGLSTNDYSNADKNKVANLGKIDFTTANFTVSGNYQIATIPAGGKYPVKVMKSNGSNYEEVIVQTSVEGDNIVICSNSAFAGYVVTV